MKRANVARDWFTLGVAIPCVLAVLGVAGCGDDDDGGGQRGSGRPDTGYGAGLSVPSPRTCDALCTRLGDCLAHLCNEDSQSTLYDVLGEIIPIQCKVTCTDALLNTEFTEANWQCLFQSSCRQVLDYDVCNTDGSYHCVGPGVGP